jgi:hypothetical protein
VAQDHWTELFDQALTLSKQPGAAVEVAVGLGFCVENVGLDELNPVAFVILPEPINRELLPLSDDVGVDREPLA